MRVAGFAVAASLVLAASYGRAQRVEETKSAKKKKDQPIRLGLVEEAGVELTLLDVEVTDKDGRPIRGLKKNDFAVTLNRKAWPVYSVDDLCECEEPTSAETVASDPAATIDPEHRVEPSVARRPSAIPTLFVLYFDFSQLQPDGRALAVEEAKRWLRESLKLGDQASIVTYGTDAGLHERCAFTSDRRQLVEAIDAIQRDPKQIEASAAFLPTRMCECGMYGAPCRVDLGRCPGHAVEEYFRGRRALKALGAFLEALGETPGRKAILYFNQSGALQPGDLFGQGIEKGGDLTSLLDDAASAAIASRATIYPVFTGDELNSNASVVNGTAVNFGANLADATGGRYNTGQIDLRSLMDTAARAGCCIYRIGLRPPSGTARGVFQARVEAGGRKVGWLYRIRFEDEMDRWMKNARAVLRHPAGARDLPVGAALVPVRSTGGRWKLSVQVALDVNTLGYLPSPEGRAAQWQVGALLQCEENDASWEMLGVSSIVRKGAAGAAEAVVHRRDIDDLRPGTYRLAAFVRDENMSLYGGAEAAIELPPPGSDRIAGPIVMRSPRKFFMAALPALKGKEKKATSVSEVRVDALPERGVDAGIGETLEVETWLCAGAAPKNGAAPLRFVSKNGMPQYRFETAAPRPAGGCVMYADAIESARLPSGPYSYHFRWNVPGRAEPQEADVHFDIGAAPAPSEAALPAPR